MNKPTTKKPAADALRSIMIRISREEYAHIEAMRVEYSEAYGSPLPIVTVLRRMLREHATARAALAAVNGQRAVAK